MASARGARVLVVGSARKNRAERIVLGAKTDPGADQCAFTRPGDIVRRLS